MVRGTLLVLAALVVVAGCSAGPSVRAYRLPGREPVGDTVLVSADGRTITALGTEVCIRAQRLVARSYPDKVALILQNPRLRRPGLRRRWTAATRDHPLARATRRPGSDTDRQHQRDYPVLR